jgi:hypothetical protein
MADYAKAKAEALKIVGKDAKAPDLLKAITNSKDDKDKTKKAEDLLTGEIGRCDQGLGRRQQDPRRVGQTSFSSGITLRPGPAFSSSCPSMAAARAKGATLCACVEWVVAERRRLSAHRNVSATRMPFPGYLTLLS